MKKIIVCLLVLSMNIGIISKSAEDLPVALFTDISGNRYEQAIVKLSELGIMKGYDDGTFKPEAILTRAEYTALMIRLLSLEKEVESAEGDQYFSDINPGYWATASINVALKNNIISGYGNGFFGPEDPVTYEQAVTILVKALGYREVSGKRAPYPWGYLLLAAEKGIITKDTEWAIGQPVSRGLAANLIYNALNVKMAGEDVALIETITGRTYYVSPDGFDDGDGTKKNPWRTLGKAAQVVQAGSTIILEDGEYYESDATIFANSGTEGAPITVRARNKHKAKLIYPDSTRLMPKMSIEKEQGYFIIQDLYFTQVSRAREEDATKTTDIFLRCRGTDCKFIGNRFEGAYEEAIKLGAAQRILIEGNVITDTTHEGIDSFGTVDVTIRNNHITEAGRVGIMVKGCARNNVVYNNFISNKNKSMHPAAITIGGESNNSVFDIKKDTGFEAYNCIFYNNIIYSQTPGAITAGLCYMGALNCHSYNNIIVGTKYGVNFDNPPGLRNGWEWDPPTINPLLKNNIFVGCTGNAYEFTDLPQNLVSDYNLFYKTAASSKEENSIYSKDPLFEQIGENWRLKQDSPAVGKGTEIPLEFEGFGGTVITIERVDFDGKPRNEIWNMGVY